MWVKLVEDRRNRHIMLHQQIRDQGLDGWSHAQTTGKRMHFWWISLTIQIQGVDNQTNSYHWWIHWERVCDPIKNDKNERYDLTKNWITPSRFEGKGRDLIKLETEILQSRETESKSIKLANPHLRYAEKSINYFL